MERHENRATLVITYLKRKKHTSLFSYKTIANYFAEPKE